MNILFISTGKIHVAHSMIIYVSPNHVDLEWLAYFDHVFQSLVDLVSVLRSTPNNITPQNL